MKTIDNPKTVADPVITEVRRHKQEIAESYGFDVIALGRALQHREVGDPRFETPIGGQRGNGQPANHPELKSEDRQNSQPESEGRSR